VLNIAIELARLGGTCLEFNIEHRRTDELYLDAIGSPEIPDPTPQVTSVDVLLIKFKPFNDARNQRGSLESLEATSQRFPFEPKRTRRTRSSPGQGVAVR